MRRSFLGIPLRMRTLPQEKAAQGEHSGPRQFIAGKRFPSANKPPNAFSGWISKTALALLRMLWRAFVS